MAENTRERMRGLLRLDSLPAGTLFLLPHCTLVHTCGMRFPIDLIFIDRNGCACKVVRSVRPWRMIWGGGTARQTLEAESGWIPEIPHGARFTPVSPP